MKYAKEHRNIAKKTFDLGHDKKNGKLKFNMGPQNVATKTAFLLKRNIPATLNNLTQQNQVIPQTGYLLSLLL